MFLYAAEKSNGYVKLIVDMLKADGTGPSGAPFNNME